MNIKEYIPFYQRNLKLAVPVMLTQAGQITVNLADNIMVGHLGTTELAGVTFANSIIVLGMVFGIGFTQGVTPHVGHCFGKGDHLNVGRLLQVSFIINILLSILLSGIMSSIGIFMGLMGQPAEVVSYARDYYYIILTSMVPALLFFGMRQFSEGIGITKYALYITVIGNSLNIFLNWVFIYGHMGFEPMGVKGAAIATLISRYTMCGAFMVLYLKLSIYKKYIKQIRRPFIDRETVLRILKTSVPLSLQNLVEITAFSLSAIMIGWNGEIALASHQIAMSMSSFSFMLALGVGAAATIRVSHQFGYGDYKSMRIAGFASIHLCVGLMSICGLLYILLRNYIPLVFTDDSQVIYLSSQLLVISALFQIFDATQLACLACLRALADVKKPLLYSIISYYLVCLPLGYLCGNIMGYGAIGVWVGLLLGLIFAASLFLWRFNLISMRLVKSHTI
ncbi:MAG: MATE family efflux transporter [Rikenellaceae bacterium]|nr:MATE family efflux transporter [Rikenellaceae bacterium]